MSALCVWAVVNGAGADSADRRGVEALRLRAVQADTFDYLFTAYTGLPEGRWSLSFNDRHGLTHFGEVGGTLGHYRILGFEPFETMVFVPSLNAERREKAGRVTLEDRHGRRHLLFMNEPLGVPGRRAALVSLDTGLAWSAREGETLLTDAGGTLMVVHISADGVTVAADAIQSVVRPLHPEEAAALAGRVRRQQDVAARGRSGASWSPALPPPVLPPLVPPHGGSPAGHVSGSRLPYGRDAWFGSEYRVPVDYQVLVLQGPDGTLRPLVLPRRFETVRGTTWGGTGYGHGHHRYAPVSGYRSTRSPSILGIPHPDTHRERLYPPRR